MNDPMSTKPHPLPAEIQEANRRFDQRLRSIDARMTVARYKFLKILLAVAVLLFGGFAIVNEANPTVTGTLTIIGAAGLAGLEVPELLDAWRDVQQARAEASNQPPDDGGDD